MQSKLVKPIKKNQRILRTQKTIFHSGGKCRFYRTARVTSQILALAKRIKQTPHPCGKTFGEVGGFAIVQNIADTVNSIPEKSFRDSAYHEAVGKHHARYLGHGKSAHQTLFKGIHSDSLPCLEKANATIALLRACGVNAWLARVLYKFKGTDKWIFHDTVEYAIKGKIESIDFNEHDYCLHKHPAEYNWGTNQTIILRGADAQQIGGVGSKAEYDKFSKRLTKDLPKELERNARRLNLLIQQGIIPKKEGKLLLQHYAKKQALNST